MKQGIVKKSKRKVSAKSLANLRPQKKGEKGHNPIGARAHNPALRALKKLTIETYREVIELALTSNRQALYELAEHPDTPAVQVGVARAMMKAIDHGDFSLVEQLAIRIVGKVPEVVNINSNNQTSLDVVDRTRMRVAMKEIESEV